MRMKTELMNRKAFLDEIDAWATEAKFNITETTLRWAHSFGEIIRRYYPDELKEQDVVSIMHDTGKSRATVFRWVALYDKEADFDKLIADHGKALSLNKILGLTAPKEETEECVCPTCGKSHKRG